MLHLHHLSIFHAVAETRNISRAADRLLISQPAVSKQMKTLEQALKTKLFDRHAKGITLTATGEALAGYAGRIFALAKQAEEELSEMNSVRRGTLSIGAGPTIGTYLLPGAMVRFKRDHPMIRLHVETHSPGLIHQRLLDGNIEFAVSESRVISDQVLTRVFMKDVLVPVVAGTDPLTRRKAISAEEFCRQPFIAREVDSPTGSLVERSLLARGFKVNPILTVTSTEAIKQAVLAGLGVAMVSRLALQTEIAAGLLVQPRIKGLSIRYPIYHLWRRGRSQSKPASIFLALLADT